MSETSPLIKGRPHATYEAFEERLSQREHDDALGDNTLGNGLSMVFLVNQIYGPGVLAIPIVFQQSGIVPTFCSLAFFFMTSSFAATSVCEAISLVPGNRNFDERIEYTTITARYLPPWGHKLTLIAINICIQCYAISSIVICAQSIDQAISWLNGTTYAFSLRDGFVAGVEHGCIGDGCSAFYGPGGWSITLGYVIMAVIIIPMSSMNLDENVKSVQVTSFAVLCLLMVVFIAYFVYSGVTLEFYPIPWFGDNYQQLAGVMISCWAYVVFVPSWVNEKKPEVNVNKLVWGTALLSFVGYFCIGLLCASVNAKVGLDNMMVHLSSDPTPSGIRVAAYCFSLGVVGLGIPVCFITSRYNLYVGKFCGVRWSYFWGVYAPWLVAWIFSQGSLFANLLNWSSLLFASMVNNVLPLVLLFVAYNRCSRDVYKSQGHGGVDPFCFTSRKRTVLRILLALVATVLTTQILWDIVMTVEGQDVLSG